MDLQRSIAAVLHPDRELTARGIMRALRSREQDFGGKWAVHKALSRMKRKGAVASSEGVRPRRWKLTGERLEYANTKVRPTVLHGVGQAPTLLPFSQMLVHFHLSGAD